MATNSGNDGGGRKRDRKQTGKAMEQEAQQQEAQKAARYRADTLLVKRIRTQELSDSSVVLQLTRNPAKKLGLVLHAKGRGGSRARESGNQFKIAEKDILTR